MKCTPIGLLLAVATLWPGPSRNSLRRCWARRSAQAPHIGEGGAPAPEKDPAWPKVPANKMGFGSAVTADEQDHIWILSRPHTAPEIGAARP
jgi:hypothetical protein